MVQVDGQCREVINRVPNSLNLLFKEMYRDQSGELLNISNDGLLAYLAPSVQQISRMYLQLLKTHSIITLFYGYKAVSKPTLSHNSSSRYTDHKETTNKATVITVTA